MNLKPALSVTEQVQLLQQRGMLIESPSVAEDFLLRNNYYRLNIYFHKLMETNNRMKTGTKFEDVIFLYQFDRWLRNQLLTLLEPIEIHVKTRIAYYLGRTYGSDCFYRRNHFKNEVDYEKVLRDFENERNRNYKDPVVIHHETIYQGKYPIWVIVEFLSFRSVSNLYACLHESDKKQVAKYAYGMNEYYLGQWLHCLSVLRNICAHYGYLFRREYALRPKLFREFRWDPADNGHLFAFCLVLKYLSEKADWERFVKSLEAKTRTMVQFSLMDYGFPKNWHSYL
jgi:abortive infection bacteriophage resistance protein